MKASYQKIFIFVNNKDLTPILWYVNFVGMRFDILQIEVTSRCNARCMMCPKTYLADWKSGDMDKHIFLSISDIFLSVNYIHLQGWGEPLLHPEFEYMVKIIKEKGVKCGFTTNGQLLSSERIKRLIDLGVDIIAISMAGADRKTHEHIRKGTDFGKIIKNAGYLTDEKERLSLKKPELVFLFIMTPLNVHQLPKFVELASELGAVRVVPNNVDFIPCRDIDELRAFNRLDIKERYEGIIVETKRKCREKRLELRMYPFLSEEQGLCEADPLKNVYISHDGCVSPCVYLGLPVDPIPFYRDGKKDYIPRTCFGNIREETLLDIWNKKEYVDFRQAFKKRRNAYLLDTIISAFGLGNGYKLPAPEVCRGCYKLSGF